MKKLRIAFLDDEPSKLKEIQLQYNHYKRLTGHDVEIDIFQNYKDLIQNFNHEVAIIDLNLKHKYDGRDVGAMLLEQHPEANLIALSCVVTPDQEPNKCLLSKVGFKFSELVSRCLYYRDNHILNSLQFLRLPSFEELAFVHK